MFPVPASPAGNRRLLIALCQCLNNLAKLAAARSVNCISQWAFSNTQRLDSCLPACGRRALFSHLAVTALKLVHLAREQKLWSLLCLMPVKLSAKLAFFSQPSGWGQSTPCVISEWRERIFWISEIIIYLKNLPILYHWNDCAINFHIESWTLHIALWPRPRFSTNSKGACACALC